MSPSPEAIGRNNIALGAGDRLLGRVSPPLPLVLVTPSNDVLNYQTNSTVNVTFAVANAQGTVTWTISSGTLPGGLNFTAGVLTNTGTITATAGTSVTFRAQDAEGTVGLFPINFIVTSPTALDITTTGPLVFQKGTTTSYTLTATGGSGTKTWTCDTTLPLGLTLDSDGTLHGDPTNAPGSSNEDFTVTDASGSVEETISIQRTVAATTSWPPTDLQGKWGMTINANATVDHATHFYGKLTGGRQGYGGWTTASAGGKGDWDFTRILVAWYNIEPNSNNVYTFGSAIRSKADWCKGRGIRPMFNFSYCTGPYTKKFTYPITRIQRVSGQNRVWITGIADGDWHNLHIKDAQGKIVTNSIITSNGAESDANGTYLVVRVPTTDTPGEHDFPTTADTATGNSVTIGWHVGASYSEDDRHVWPSPANYINLAKAVVALLVEFKDYNPAVELWNEANIRIFSTPSQDALGGPEEYGQMFKYFYRAVKEYNPNIPVVTSGLANNNAPSNGSWQMRPEDWHQRLFRSMKTDSEWRTWVESTTPLISGTVNGETASNHTMASLLASGEIDHTFWGDYLGFHAYCWGRVGGGGTGQLGVDNFDHFHNSNGGTRAPAKIIVMLNDGYIEDPPEIVFTGTRTGGTFTLGVNVYTGVLSYDPKNNVWYPTQTAGTTVQTSALNHDATDAQIASAIQAKTGGTVTVRSHPTIADRKRIFFSGTTLVPASPSRSRRIEITKGTNNFTGTSPDFSVSRNALSRMVLISTETGPPLQCLAVTGRGWTGSSSTNPGGRASRRTDALRTHDGELKGEYSIASAEESYINTVSLKRILRKDLNLPTSGTQWPVKVYPGDTRDRIGLFIFQWVSEGGYDPYTVGDDVFCWQGVYTDNVCGETGQGLGDERMLRISQVTTSADRDKALKSARPVERPGGSWVPSGQSRPYLNGTNGYPDADWGTGCDIVDAFNWTG